MVETHTDTLWSVGVNLLLVKHCDYERKGEGLCRECKMISGGMVRKGEKEEGGECLEWQSGRTTGIIHRLIIVGSLVRSTERIEAPVGKIGWMSENS